VSLLIFCHDHEVLPATYGMVIGFPPYSPDLISTNFYIFPAVETTSKKDFRTSRASRM